MRILRLLVIVATLSFLYGCQETTTDPPIKPASTLIVSAESLALTKAAPVDSSIVRLSCGCNFTLVVEGYTGDTSVISFDDHDASTLEYTGRGLTFTADTTSAAGTYSAALAFLSTGSKGDFRDTIHVTYTR